MSNHTPAAVDNDRLSQRLAGWLSTRLRADDTIGDAGVTRLRCELAGPVPTGNSNVTMPFTAHWHDGRSNPMSIELVLRMQVPSNQIFLDADVLREYETLVALADTAVAAPRPRWVERDPAVLGQPFFVMDCIAGTVPTGSPTIHAAGWFAERTLGERRTAWESSLASLSKIGTVDWAAIVPALATRASGATLATRLDHLAEWYEWVTKGRSYPVTDAGLAYLTDNVPTPSGPPGFVWGDARLGNLMFATNHSVAAVLDWELASIGPIEIDLGWWLAFDEFTTSAHGVAPLPGYPDRCETIAHYEHLVGRRVDDLAWYEAHAAWVLTVTVIRMADIGVAAGRLPADNRMGEGNLTAQMLARALDLPVPDLDPYYAARRGLT